MNLNAYQVKLQAECHDERCPELVPKAHTLGDELGCAAVSPAAWACFLAAEIQNMEEAITPVSRSPSSSDQIRVTSQASILAR
ncbi:hypothetical protein GX51_05159 [Blastomyces parvus]|uniref:Uncharacterized protein n=1 Tax=Blastomyces parvus TaxID=2060905 RepID=A0A2B7WQE8_9EURO|nr:hypothetical protein GX51_05159 [Blastomyces parvus]